MRIFALAQRPTRWVRITLAALVLAFGLNALAHAGHSHQDGAATTHAAHCGYCATFDRVVDGPRPIVLVVVPARYAAASPQASPQISHFRPAYRPVSRGPPAA